MEVKIHHAKTHLSRLLVRVAVPFNRPSRDRTPGQDRGRLQIAEDFDRPLPEKILRTFEV